MKQTLLDLTQEILSSLDSDEVNSISDTTEAMQVAQVIRRTYFNIIARANLPEHKQLFTLESSDDGDEPVLMTKPDNISRVDWLKYRQVDDVTDADTFQYVNIVSLQQFLDMVGVFDPDEDNVGEMDFNGFTFRYKNDHQPCYCTVVNDTYFIFDSYDSEVDDTLQTNKTLGFGQVVPSFELQDNFTPDMDEQQFPLLLNEAKALAFFELKQMPHSKAEQESKRQWVTLQRTKNLVKPSAFDKLPDFGRRNTTFSRFPNWMRGT